MKKFFTILLLMAQLQLLAQNNIAPTESFTVEGLVKKTLVVTLKDLSALPSKQIDSIVITNHLYQRKSVLTNVQGVSLKEVLATLQLQEENPKLFSEFYFVFISSDGYRVVFSWNELFNNELGNHVLIITGHDGRKLPALDNRIAIICYKDTATGRRYVKSLQKIMVERVR